MKKSILALLLAVIMAVSLLPAAVLADGNAASYTSAKTGKTTVHTTIDAAINDANNNGGGTIKLLRDVTTSNNLFLQKQITLTLDLNDHTLTSTAVGGITIGLNKYETEGSHLTIKNGTYKNTNPQGTALWGFAGGSITIAEDAVIEAVDCIITGDNSDTSGRTVINVYGKLISEGTAVWCQGPLNEINIEGAVIDSDGYGVYHTSKFGGSTISIKDSEVTGDNYSICIGNNPAGKYGEHTLSIENSKIYSDGFGIWAQYTDVDIKGKNTVISVPDGYAIAVTHNGDDTTPAGTLGTVDIEGGTFIGEIAEKDPTGGASNAAAISVSGGEFDRPVKPDYLADGYIYQLLSAGVYTYYKTIEEALAAAKPGDIITDLDSNTAMEVFAVTVEPNNGQTATTTLVQDGGTYVIPAAPTRDGYAFLGWSADDNIYKPGDEYTVTEDTTFTALWKEEYNVVYIYNNGAATGHKTVLKGESVILPTPSKSGYAFLGWTCSDGNVYDGGDSVVIWGNTTFEASWVRHPDTPYVPEPSEPVEPDVPSFPFYDVPTSAWYYTAVKYVYDNKLMDGVDTYVFAPNDTLTRAMVWTIIARMSGVDTTGGNSWYAKAQEWVITNGISDGENPTAAITRQELVTMLYRYAQIKGYDVSVGESTNILSYVDATSISEYAMSAFQWACGSGLTEGDENGALTPLATATRAQAAAMIMRFCESVK